MLKYLILVSESLAVPAILLGLLYAHASANRAFRGRRVLTASALTGLVATAAYALLRNATKIIDKSGGNGMWNVRVFAVSTAALLLFYIFNLPPLRRKLRRASDAVALAAAALLAFTFVFYALPEVLTYPYNFNLGGESIYSTAFFYRFAGYLLGLAVGILIFLAAWRTAGWLKPGMAMTLLNLALLVNGLEQITKALNVLLSRRVISGRWLFQLIRFTTNHSNLFIYAAMAIALVAPLILWIRSFNVREPYSNPAEHRKIRARWRGIRRWSAMLAACFAVVALCLTVFTAIDSRVVELSPVEESEVADDKVYIPLAQVDDGHLHRFAYTTAGGVDVRFIIIKKPNSSSYGIGLDACEMCGETGYFERNGQVVCKLCDVVMNVNTIGFKGGCNPIPVDYAVEEGFIVLPGEALAAHEKTFKK